MPNSTESLRARATTHGRSGTSEYNIWNSMRERCGNPKHKSFAAYGGAGITVCERWHTFENFYADIGPRPSPRHSIDRFPNKAGNYELGNVRWATVKEQNNNRKSTRLVTHQGKTHSLKLAVESAGSNYDAVLARLRKGWSVEQAIDTPIRVHRSKSFVAQLSYVTTMLDQTNSERLDAEFERDLQVIRDCMERTS